MAAKAKFGQNVAKTMNPLYPTSPDGAPTGGRVLRVLAWAALVAGVTTIGFAFAIWTGGISIAASQSIVAFIAKEALFAAAEGCVYATYAEWRDARASSQARANSMQSQSARSSMATVRRISVAELEAQIKALESRLAAERQRVAESVH